MLANKHLAKRKILNTFISEHYYRRDVIKSEIKPERRTSFEVKKIKTRLEIQKVHLK